MLPITSILVCVANASGSLHEELPYGYELVKTYEHSCLLCCC